MHRTQVLLEDWQYEALKQQAERQQKSLSSLLRETLNNTLLPRSRRKRTFRDLEGIGKDSAFSGRDHDEAIYGR